eukprot:GHVN01075082.1.p1 GENE.GHVN01075082.1~~GHVN01075082.1.p1  ORF type:complete len:389 (-),score=34.60 GHVN01075082.1:54-1220(-)
MQLDRKKSMLFIIPLAIFGFFLIVVLIVKMKKGDVEEMGGSVLKSETPPDADYKKGDEALSSRNIKPGMFSFLFITDVHLSEKYVVGDSKTTFKGDHFYADYYGGKGFDMPLYSYQPFIKQIKTKVKHPDFIVLGGDMGPHSSENTDKCVKAYQKVMDETQNEYPTTQIIPILGNNDFADSGGGIISSKSYEKYYNMWNKTGLLKEQKRIFTTLGCYHTKIGGVYIIVLNTNSMATDCPESCHDKQKGCYQQMEWLERTLKSIKNEGEKAYVVGHHPPLDPFCKRDAMKMLFKCLGNYKETVHAFLAGHTHQDDFHVYGNTGILKEATKNPLGVILVTPSVSKNPGAKARVYECGANGDLLDYKQYCVSMQGKSKPGFVVLRPRFVSS